MSLRTRPVAFQQTETIKPGNTESQPDKGAGASGARGAHLGATDSLRGGTGSLPSPPIALRVGARMTEQFEFSLTGPRLPLRRWWSEQTVQPSLGVVAQEGPKPVFRDAGRRDKPVSQCPVEIASEPQ